MYVLDTNVVSELRKVQLGKADPNVEAWFRSVDDVSLYLSAVVIEELEIGTLIVERRDSRQGRILRDWLDGSILAVFEGRILPVDTTVALRAAALHVPDRRPARDGFIAATALVHRMSVVTRNVADFAPTGVATFNPWLG